MKATKISWRQ